MNMPATCPACGQCETSYTVSAVDHGAGVVTLASAVQSVKFYPGMPVVFRVGRSRWRRFLGAVRAARMAWAR